MGHDLNAERVIVFDDPVSSLDSDVLFIVSALIKRVLDEACRGDGFIKQVFVMTHNIYFHKEVSFDPKRGKECRSHETFWIVRKLNDESVVVGHNYNPISTSYELLWQEVRSPDRSKITLQNTLRRILENYFKILGNLDKDVIVELFEGRDQQICGSLFSWVNDGSHSFNDDLYISADDAVIARYLDVFRRIFEVTRHQAHYEMMMGAEALAAAASANADAGIEAPAVL
jgi:wobble nucleotide-excising tRNase